MAHSAQRNITNMVSINFSVKGASAVSKHAKEIGDGFKTSWENAKKALKEYEESHARLGNEHQYDADVKALKGAVKATEKDFKAWQEMFDKGMVDYQKFMDYLMKYEGLGTPQLNQMLNAIRKTIKNMGPLFNEEGEAIEETQKKLSAMAQSERLFAAQTDARIKGVIDLTTALDRLNTTYGEASNYVKAYERNAKDLAKSPEHLQEMNRAALQNKIAMHECVGEWKQLNRESTAQDFQQGIRTFKDISQWAQRFGIDIKANTDMMGQLQTIVDHFGSKEAWHLLSPGEIEQNLKDLRQISDMTHLSSSNQQELSSAIRAGQLTSTHNEGIRMENRISALYGKNFEEIRKAGDNFIKQEMDSWQILIDNAERGSEVWLKAKDAYSILSKELARRKMNDAVSVMEGNSSAYAQMKKEAEARQDSVKAEIEGLSVKMEAGEVIYKSANDEQKYAEASERIAHSDELRLKIAEKKYEIQQKERELNILNSKIDSTTIHDTANTQEIEDSIKTLRKSSSINKEKQAQATADKELIQLEIDALERQKSANTERSKAFKEQENQIERLKTKNAELAEQEKKNAELAREYGKLITEQEAETAKKTIKDNLRGEVDSFLTQDLSGQVSVKSSEQLIARARRYQSLIKEQMENGTWDGPETQIARLDRAIDLYKDKLNELQKIKVRTSKEDTVITQAANSIEGEGSAIDKAIKKEEILRRSIEETTEAHRLQIMSMGEKYGPTQTERNITSSTNNFKKVYENIGILDSKLLSNILKTEWNNIAENPVFEKDEDTLTQKEERLMSVLEEKAKTIKRIIEYINAGTDEKYESARTALKPLVAEEAKDREKALSKYSYTQSGNEIEDFISKLQVQRQRISDQINELDHLSEDEIRKKGTASNEKLEDVKEDIKDIREQLKLATADTSKLENEQEAYAQRVAESKTKIESLKAQRHALSDGEKEELRHLVAQDNAYQSYKRKLTEIERLEMSIGTDTNEKELVKKIKPLTDEEQKRMEYLQQNGERNKAIEAQLNKEKELLAHNTTLLEKKTIRLQAINNAKKEEIGNQEILNKLLAEKEKLSANRSSNELKTGKAAVSSEKKDLAQERGNIDSIISKLKKRKEKFDFSKAYFDIYGGEDDFKAKTSELNALSKAIHSYNNGNTAESKHAKSVQDITSTIAELQKERDALGSNASALDLLEAKIKSVEHELQNTARTANEISNNQAASKLSGKDLLKMVRTSAKQAKESTDALSSSLKGIARDFSEIGKTKTDPYKNLINQSSKILTSFDQASKVNSSNWVKYVTSSVDGTNIFAEKMETLRTNLKAYNDASEKKDKNGNIVQQADIDKMHLAGEAVKSLVRELKKLRPEFNREVFNSSDIEDFYSSISKAESVAKDKLLQGKDMTDPVLAKMTDGIITEYKEMFTSMSYQEDKVFRDLVNERMREDVKVINDAIAKYKSEISSGISYDDETLLRRDVYDAFTDAKNNIKAFKNVYDTRSVDEIRKELTDGYAVTDYPTTNVKDVEMETTAIEKATLILQRYQKQKESGLGTSFNSSEEIEANERAIKTLEKMVALKKSLDEEQTSVSQSLEALRESKKQLEADENLYGKNAARYKEEADRKEQLLLEKKDILNAKSKYEGFDEEMTSQEYMNALIEKQTESIKAKELAEKELSDLEKTYTREQIDADHELVAEKDKLATKLRSLNDEMEKNARVIESINHAESNSNDESRFSNFSIDQIKEAMNTWQDEMRKCFNNDGQLTTESKERWEQLNEQYKLADKYLRAIEATQKQTSLLDQFSSMYEHGGSISMTIDEMKRLKQQMEQASLAAKQLGQDTVEIDAKIAKIGNTIEKKALRNFAELRKEVLDADGLIDSQRFLSMDADKQKKLLQGLEEYARKALAAGTERGETIFKRLTHDAIELQDATKHISGTQLLMQMEHNLSKEGQTSSYYDGVLKQMAELRDSGKLTGDEIKKMDSALYNFSKSQFEQAGRVSEFSGTNEELKTLITNLVRYRDMIKDPQGSGIDEWDKVEEKIMSFQKLYEELTAMRAKSTKDTSAEYEKWIDKAVKAKAQVNEAINPANGMNVSQMETMMESYKKLLHEGLSITSNPDNSFIKSLEGDINRMCTAIETRYRDMITNIKTNQGSIDKTVLTEMSDSDISKLKSWMNKESSRMFANNDMGGFRRMVNDLYKMDDVLKEIDANKNLNVLFNQAEKRGQTTGYYNNVIIELEKLRDSGNLAISSIEKLDRAIKTARENQYKDARETVMQELTGGGMFEWDESEPTRLVQKDFSGYSIEDLEKIKRELEDMRKYLKPESEITLIQQTDVALNEIQKSLDSTQKKMRELKEAMTINHAWDVAMNPLSHSTEEVSKAMNVLEDASRMAASGMSVSFTENGVVVEKSMDDIQQHIQSAKNAMDRYATQSKLPQMEEQLTNLTELTDDALKTQATYWKQMLTQSAYTVDDVEKYKKNLEMVEEHQKQRIRERGISAMIDLGGRDVLDLSINELKTYKEELETWKDTLAANGDDYKHVSEKVLELSNRLDELNKKASEGKKIFTQYQAAALQLGEEGFNISDFKGTFQDLENYKQSLEELKTTLSPANPEDAAKLKQLSRAYQNITGMLAQAKEKTKTFGTLTEDTYKRVLSTVKKNQKAVHTAINDGKFSIEDFRNSLSRMKHELETNNWKAWANSIEEANNAVTRMNNEVRQLNEDTHEQTSWLDDAISSLRNNLLIFTGGTQLFQKLPEAFSANIQLSDEMTNVAKVTQMNAGAIADLTNKLQDLDTRHTTDQLMEMAEQAGKLGIYTRAGTDGIVGFVSAAEKITGTLGEDIGGAEAVANLVKVSDLITGESGDIEEKLNRVGSAILNVGNNSAASYKDVSDFIQATGAVGKTSGLDITQLTAIGATLSSLGAPIEASATSINKFMVGLSRNIEQVAYITDLSATELRKMINEGNSFEALLQILDKVGESGAGMSQTIYKILDAFGGRKNAQLINTLSLMAQNTRRLREELSYATDGYEDGTLMAEEFHKANNNLAGSLERLKNNFNEIFVNADVQTYIKGAVNNIRYFTEHLKGATISISAIVLAIASLIKIIYQFKTVTQDTWIMMQAKNLGTAIKAIGLSIGVATTYITKHITEVLQLTRVSNLAAESTRNLSNQLNAMKTAAASNWIIALVTLLTLLIGYLVQYEDITEKAEKESQLIAHNEEDKYRRAKQSLDDASDSLQKSIKTKEKAVRAEKQLQEAHKKTATDIDKNRATQEALDATQKDITDTTKSETDAVGEVAKAHDEAAEATQNHHQMVQEFNSSYSSYIGFELKDADSAELVALAHYKVANALRSEADARTYQRQKEAIYNLYDDEIDTDATDLLANLQAHFPENSGEIFGKFMAVIQDRVEKGDLVPGKVIKNEKILYRELGQYIREIGREGAWTWHPYKRNVEQLIEDFYNRKQALASIDADHKSKQKKTQELDRKSNEALSVALIRQALGESKDEVASQLNDKGTTEPTAWSAPFLPADDKNLSIVPSKKAFKTQKIQKKKTTDEFVDKEAKELPTMLQRLASIDVSKIDTDRLENVNNSLESLKKSLAKDFKSNTIGDTAYNKALKNIANLQGGIQKRLNVYRKTQFWGTENGNKGFKGYRPETLVDMWKGMDEFQRKMTDNMDWDAEGVRDIFDENQVNTLRNMSSSEEAREFIVKQVRSIKDYLHSIGLNDEGHVDKSSGEKELNEAKKKYEALIKELDNYFVTQKLRIEEQRADGKLSEEEFKHRIDANSIEHKTQRDKLRNMFEKGYKNLFDETTGEMTDEWIKIIFGRGDDAFSTSTWKTALANTRKLLHQMGDELMDDIKLKSSEDKVEAMKMWRTYQDEFENALIEGKPLEKVLDTFEKQADKLHLLFGLKDFKEMRQHSVEEYQSRMEVLKVYSSRVAAMTEEEFRDELSRTEGFHDRMTDEYTLLYNQLSQLHDSYEEAIRKKAKKEAKLLENRVESGQWYEVMYKKFDSYIKALEDMGVTEGDVYERSLKTRQYFYNRMTKDGVSYYHKQQELLEKLKNNAKTEDIIGGMGLDTGVHKAMADIRVARQELLMSRDDLNAKLSIYSGIVQELDDVRDKLSAPQTEGETDNDYKARIEKLKRVEFELSSYRVANEEIVKAAKEKNVEANNTLIAKEHELLNQRITGINQWRAIFDELSKSMVAAGSNEADSKNWEIAELNAKKTLGLVSDTARQRMIILKKSGDYEVKWLNQQEQLEEEKRIAAMNDRAEALEKFFHDFGEKLSQDINNVIMHQVQKNLAKERAEEIADVEAEAQAAGLMIQQKQQEEYNETLSRILNERAKLFTDAQKVIHESMEADSIMDVTMHTDGLNENTSALNSLTISMASLTDGLNEWMMRIRTDRASDLADATGKGAAISSSSWSRIAKRKYITERLTKELGLTGVQAYGVLGNLEHESGLNPSAKNPHSTAYGIAQWLSPRQKSFRQMMGHDIKGTPLEEQTTFLIKEMKSRQFAPMLKALRKADTVEKASDIVYHQYEIPYAIRGGKKVQVDHSGEARRKNGVNAYNISMEHDANLVPYEGSMSPMPFSQEGSTLTNRENVNIQEQPYDYASSIAQVTPPLLDTPRIGFSNADQEELIKAQKENQIKLTKLQKEGDKERKKSATDTAQAMMQAANMYGIVYQAVTNKNLTTHQRAQQAMLGVVGQVTNATLSAMLQEYTAQQAADQSLSIGKAFAKLGPIKGAALVAGITAMFALMLGMVTNSISKSQSKISSITGASSAGKLSTGMLTYASGRYHKDKNTGMGGMNGGVSFGNDSDLSYIKGKSYNVHGNDGMDYNAIFDGRNLTTGIRKGEHFGIFSEKKPELVVDGETTAKLVNYYPNLYNSIISIANGKDPQLSIDYSYITKQLSVLGLIQAQGKINMAKGMPTFAAGSYPYDSNKTITDTGGMTVGVSRTGMQGTQDGYTTGLSEETVQNLIEVLGDLSRNGVRAALDIVELDKRQARYNRWKAKNGVE